MFYNWTVRYVHKIDAMARSLIRVPAGVMSSVNRTQTPQSFPAPCSLDMDRCLESKYSSAKMLGKQYPLAKELEKESSSAFAMGMRGGGLHASQACDA